MSKPLKEMTPYELEEHMESILESMDKLILNGTEFIIAEKVAEGEIHIAEGIGFAECQASTTKAKEMYAKIRKGQAEKDQASNVALGWATRNKFLKLRAELDVCRSIYSQRKIELEKH